MHLKTSFFTLLFFSAVFICNAQSTQTKKKFTFQSLNQIGVVTGSADEALQLQTINGVKYGSYFFGAGLGFDNYYIRSIPLFFHVSKTTGKKSATPFLYADGGYNIPWLQKHDYTLVWDGIEKTTGGAYYEIGFGYQAPVFKNTKFLLSIGYSHKEVSQKVNTMDWLPIPPPPEAYETYRYYLRRIAIKAGLSF